MSVMPFCGIQSYSEEFYIIVEKWSQDMPGRNVNAASSFVLSVRSHAVTLCSLCLSRRLLLLGQSLIDTLISARE